MKKVEEYMLTEGIVWKKMIQFALPIFLGTIFQSFYVTVDAIIIGQFAGKEALSAIEAILGLTRMPVAFLTGLSTGATIIIAQYVGKKEFDKVSEATNNAIMFSILAGSIVSLFSCLASPYAISLVNVPTEIVSSSQKYIIIYFLGFPMAMIYNMSSGVLRALGNSKTPFYYLVIANIINIILDLIFVAYFNMGVVGVAIATLISQFVSAILMLNLFFRTKLPCRIFFKELRMYREHIKNIFSLGLPIALQNMMFSISNATVQSSINTFGVDMIAAWSVSVKIDTLVWSISSALGSATSTFVAQNYGAKKYDRISNGIKSAGLMNAVCLAIIALTLFFFSDFLGRLIINDDVVIVNLLYIMKLLAPCYILYSLIEILPGAIRGTGDTFKPMLITMLGTCLLRVLWVIFITPFKHEILLTLAVYPVSWIVSTLMFLIYYKLFVDKKLRK